MSWSRCSSVVLAALVLVLVASAPVAAVSVSAENVPGDSGAEVDEEVTATYTLEELYDEYDEWTLVGETELTETTWTVSLYDQTDSRIERNTYNNQSFEQAVSADEDVNYIEVEVTGTVPEVREFTYEAPQTFEFATLTQTQDGGASAELRSDDVWHYTQDSKEARAAIDSAAAAVEGSGSSEAKSDLDAAISSFENGNFENAQNLAQSAEDAANDAQQSEQRNRMILYAVAALVALLVVGGVVYWLLSNRDTGGDPLS